METGLVLKSTGSWYKVKNNNGLIFDCRIMGKMREEGIRSTNPIAVGDVVDFEIESQQAGIIKNIHERKNYIIRRSPNLSKESHIVAANIDMAFLMVSLRSPKTPIQFIDRFLVSAQAYNIPVIIVFNKIDIYTEEETELLNELTDLYSNIGYECLKISVKELINIDIIKNKIAQKTSLFSGNSGVGKSSLMNILEPQLDIKTAQVSKCHDKGKHTTTFAEMYELPQGGYIIDTPGLKGFGLLRMESNEICHYFPEMFALSEKCEYYNCTHIHEPGCEIIKAVQDGRIHLSRYENYLGMVDDCKEEKYRR